MAESTDQGGSPVLAFGGGGGFHGAHECTEGLAQGGIRRGRPPIAASSVGEDAVALGYLGAEGLDQGRLADSGHTADQDAYAVGAPGRFDGGEQVDHLLPPVDHPSVEIKHRGCHRRTGSILVPAPPPQRCRRCSPARSQCDSLAFSCGSRVDHDDGVRAAEVRADAFPSCGRFAERSGNRLLRHATVS